MLTKRSSVNDEPNPSSFAIATSANKLRDHNSSIAQFVNAHPFPCSVDEVFSLAISLQYYIGNLYLEMADICHEPQKTEYLDIALQQLENKKTIENNCNDYLNELMDYFYKTGGPIMDDRVSELQSKEIQAFFQRILTNLLTHFDILVDMSFNGSLSLEQMQTEVNYYTLHSYASWGKLYRNVKIQRAFNELMNTIPRCIVAMA